MSLKARSRVFDFADEFFEKTGIIAELYKGEGNIESKIFTGENHKLFYLIDGRVENNWIMYGVSFLYTAVNDTKLDDYVAVKYGHFISDCSDFEIFNRSKLIKEIQREVNKYNKTTNKKIVQITYRLSEEDPDIPEIAQKYPNQIGLSTIIHLKSSENFFNLVKTVDGLISKL